MQTFKICNLSFSYPSGTGVFSNRSFEMPREGMTVLSGPNGSGKTTLLRLLGGLLPSNNSSLSELRESYRLVYIDENILSLPYLTVGKYLDMIIELADVKPHYDLVTSVMRDTIVGNLSTGQRARLCLSIAMGTSCDLMILDEPFNGLDQEGRQIAVSAIQSFDHAVLLASHDADIIGASDHRLMLS